MSTNVEKHISETEEDIFRELRADSAFVAGFPRIKALADRKLIRAEVAFRLAKIVAKFRRPA
jgi:hypothetical protein